MTDALGLQISADIIGSEYNILDSLKFLDVLLSEGVEYGRLKIIGKKLHQFEPYGVTIAYLLETSHLTMHSWPEQGKALIDLLSCDWKSNPYATIWYILRGIRPKDGEVKVDYRGTFDSSLGLYLPRRFSLEEYLSFASRESRHPKVSIPL